MFTGIVTPEWTAGLTGEARESVPLGALSDDAVTVEARPGVTSLGWGAGGEPRSRLEALNRNHLFDPVDDGAVFELAPIRFINEETDVTAFGGGVLTLSFAVDDPAGGPDPIELAVDVELAWSDLFGGEANTAETGAFDELRIVDSTTDVGGGLVLEVLGFSEDGGTTIEQAVRVSEDNLGVFGAIVGRLAGDMPGEDVDFVLDGPPLARRVDGGTVGPPDAIWTEGEIINLAQVIGNDGTDRSETYEAVFTLNRVASGFTVGTQVGRELNRLADLDFPFGEPRPLDGGERTAFGFSVPIDDRFLLNYPAGEYFLFSAVNPLGRVPETDTSNNRQPLDALPRITVSENPPIETAEAAVGGIVLGTAAADLFLADAPSGIAIEDGDGDGIDSAHYRSLFRADNERALALIGIPPDGDGIGASAAADGQTLQVELSDLRSGLTDTLTGVERLSLADGVFLFDLPGADVAFTYRLYSAAFARVPDERGLRFWNDQRNADLGDRAMAEAFIGSPEFAEKFGADPTDEDFIGALYGNVLLREPDTRGEAFWLDAFSSGALDRADMLLAFSDSTENLERNEENYEAGFWVI